MAQESPEGAVVWFCGLPCSGKSTLARELRERCAQRDTSDEGRGAPVLVLDGDGLRQPEGLLYNELGYSFEPEQRKADSTTIARAARLFAQQSGALVIVAAVTPFDASRRYAKRICPNCLVVWLSTPLGTCESRDVRGRWAAARRGELRNWPGLDLAFEPCPWADVVLDTAELTSGEAASVVAEALEKLWVRG